MKTPNNNQSATQGLSRRHFLNVSSLALASTLLARRGLAQGASPTPMLSLTGEAMPKSEGRFALAPLPYAYGALEPFIDEETMHLHHDKHYAAYAKNLNEALMAYPELQAKTIEELLGNIPTLPEAIRKIVRNHGGGYYNHSLFWRWMQPGGSTPEGALAEAINAQFGGLDVFKKKFTMAAASIFGSGWAWLVQQDGGKLAIVTTPNQDNPLMSGISEALGKPILGLDIWEHAYYLKYRNERSKYVEAWWNVVNWNTAGQLFKA